jgi:hypothetical protein
MEKMSRPLCVGLALGCFQAIISSKEIIDYNGILGNKAFLSMCVGLVRQATLNEQAFWLLLRLKSNCILP